MSSAPHVARVLEAAVAPLDAARQVERRADLLAFSDEVRALSPLGDLERLRELRGALLRSLATQENENVRCALDVVSMQQSRVARVVSDLWDEGGSARFTSCLVRALGSVAWKPSSRAELEGALSGDEFSFFAGPLVEAGMVSRRNVRAGDECDTLFELTSAGSRVLPVLAKWVIDNELNRFSVPDWPAQVITPPQAAASLGVDLFSFERSGEDGKIVADCLEVSADPFRALSLPRLLGVGRSQAPSADSRWHSFALFNRREPAAVAAEEVPPPKQPGDGQMKAILADCVDLIERAGGERGLWRLNVLMPEALRADAEPRLQELCERERVNCAVVT